MTGPGRSLAIAFSIAALFRCGSPAAAQEPPAGLIERIETIRAGLDDIDRSLADGDADRADAIALRLYLDEFEPIEGWWGPGGPHATTALASRVTAGEAAFHALIAADAAALPGAVARVRLALEPLEREAHNPAVVRVPRQAAADAAPVARGAVEVPSPRTAEIAGLVSELERGRSAYRDGRAEPALVAVEHAYLEGFEPLESRLPSDLVGRIERAIHLTLRPSIREGAPVEEIDAAFAALYADLELADARLSGGASFWFGAVNAFAIIFREGLEAVLLVGAMLAYLGRMAGGRRYQRQVYAGVGAGVLASLATWVAAVTLVPVSGASRELVEGVTALVAVGVLLYVSHWLFQKTYIHDWKAYLEQHLGRAVTRGSAFAMAGLAFAAVYREGFETVLFYQALMFDAGAGAVLAGFLPGILIIAAIGYGIVRLGLRLPLRRVFGVTGSVLLYLAFVFIGKGLYNLQEAGLFSPHPLPWMPDHEALRQLLGLYPLAETLLAQAGFLTLLAVAALWHRARSRAAAATHAAETRAMDSAPEVSESRADRVPGRPHPHAPRPEPQEVA
jgi:high-affinity iron transporter